MSTRTVDIGLLPHQIEFLKSDAPSTGLVAGFGSGKSFVATVKSVIRMGTLKCSVGYYLPTYQLIKSIAFENFSNVFDSFEIPYKLHETDMVFRTVWGTVYLRSMDKPSNIIGYETGYSIIDEADVLPTDKMSKAFKAIVARNRTPVKGVNCTDMVSTPEGFKFLYDYYVKNQSDRRRLIQANTLDNPYLSESYIENLYDSYPKELIEAYMKGQVVNLATGNVYRNFDRKLHSDTEPRDIKGQILYLGMDFNITNMAAVVSLFEGKKIHIFDEIVGAYDTADMISKIRERYPENRIVVYPDAAGKARNTAGQSDHDMLKKAKFKVISPSSNPAVRDRINAANNAFEKGNLTIDGNRCPSLLEALENQGYNKNGEPDKQSGMDHILDAATYLAHNSKNVGIKHLKSSTF